MNDDANARGGSPGEAGNDPFGGNAPSGGAHDASGPAGGYGQPADNQGFGTQQSPHTAYGSRHAAPGGYGEPQSAGGQYGSPAMGQPSQGGMGEPGAPSGSGYPSGAGVPAGYADPSQPSYQSMPGQQGQPGQPWQGGAPDQGGMQGQQQFAGSSSVPVEGQSNSGSGGKVALIIGALLLVILLLAAAAFFVLGMNSDDDDSDSPAASDTSSEVAPEPTGPQPDGSLNDPYNTFIPVSFEGMLRDCQPTVFTITDDAGIDPDRDVPGVTCSGEVGTPVAGKQIEFVDDDQWARDAILNATAAQNEILKDEGGRFVALAWEIDNYVTVYLSDTAQGLELEVYPFSSLDEARTVANMFLE